MSLSTPLCEKVENFVRTPLKIDKATVYSVEDTKEKNINIYDMQ